MADEKHDPTLWQMLKDNFPLQEFIVGAVIPIFIYYVFDHLGQTLTGAILSTGWGVIVALLTRFLLKKTNLFAVLSIPCSLIELLGILVTHDPDFYLIWPAIEKTLWGAVFLGSVAISRPLILMIAQAMGMCPKNEELGEFGKTAKFHAAWKALTAIWGVVYLVAAVLLLFAHLWMSLEIFLIFRGASGTPLMALLLTFSFWFPKWYWKRSAPEAVQEVQSS